MIPIIWHSGKIKNYGDNKKISSCQGLEVGGKDKYVELRGLLGQWKCSVSTPTSRWICVIIHLSRPVECTPPNVNPNLNCGIWVMTCQCRFISYKKCTPLAGDGDNRGSCACLGALDGNFCTFLNFAVNLELLLKRIVLGASLVVQWLRVFLPMQGTWVRALVWEDPTCHGATKPVSHNYWACASGACAPQQERPR